MSNDKILQRGKIIVLSGPSGVGKTTVCNMLRQTIPNLIWSVSVTTRPLREGEIEGKDYYFVSDAEFKKKLENQEFLEYALVHDHYYGTLKAPVEQGLQAGNHYLLEIDVQGGQNVKKQKPNDTMLIFIAPPSIDALRQRLIARNRDSTEVIEKRIRNATRELEQSNSYDYIVVNINLDQTVVEVCSIVKKALHYPGPISAKDTLLKRLLQRIILCIKSVLKRLLKK